MKPKRMFRLFAGAVLPALYELFSDGSGVGMRKRLNRLKGWADK